jgi:hypothetical protein
VLVADKSHVEKCLAAAQEKEAQLTMLLAASTAKVAALTKSLRSPPGAAPSVSPQQQALVPPVLQEFEGLEHLQAMQMIGELIGQLEIRGSYERKRADDIMRLRDGHQALLSDRYSPSDFYPEKSGACRWFFGCGVTDDVPHYLRAEGRVRNNKFSLKALKAKIHTFMTDDAGSESSTSATDIKTRFHDWMAHVHGEDTITMTYSFLHALELFPYDVDVLLFKQLMEGKTSEEVWKQPYHIAQLMKEEMERLSVADGHGGQRLPRSDIIFTIYKFLAVWEVGHIQHVASIVPYPSSLDGPTSGSAGSAAASNNSTVEFRGFFANKKHVEADFLLAVRTLCLIERQRFVDDLQQCILEDGNIAFHRVTPSMVVRALAAVDPMRPEEMVVDALKKIFGPNVIPRPQKEDEYQPQELHRITTQPRTATNSEDSDAEDVPISNRFDTSELFMTPADFMLKANHLPWVRFARRQPLQF